MSHSTQCWPFLSAFQKKSYQVRACLSAGLLGGLIFSTLSVQAQSLDAVIREALKAYPGVSASAASLESAKAEIERAKGAYSPTLSLNASTNIKDSLADQKPMATPWVTWNVPINGRVSADVLRSESAAKAAQAKLQVVRDDVALQVSEAWLAVVRGEQMVFLAQENVAEHASILGNVRKMVAIDAGRSLDLTQAQVRLDAAQNNLTQRRTELIQAREKLSRYFSAEVSSAAFFRYPMLPKMVPGTYGQALSELNSPVLDQVRAQLEEAQARVDAAQRMHNPTLDFSLGRQFLGVINGTHTVATANFSFPIWQGGQVQAGIRSAIAQAVAAKDTAAETELVVKERVRLAYAELDAAKERAALANQQRENGAKLVYGFKEQFRTARRTLLDLLNIQSEYAGYQQAEALAQYDVQIAQYRISAALGQLAQSFAAP